MKNPCFWEDYKPKDDPYVDSPYAPAIGESIKYDPSGHTSYFQKARDRFNAHLVIGDDGQTKRLRCLPYFYLISTPKSGTTTLWNQLRKKVLNQEGPIKSSSMALMTNNRMNGLTRTRTITNFEKQT